MTFVFRDFSGNDTGTATSRTLTVPHPTGTAVGDLELLAENSATSMLAPGTLNIPSTKQQISSEQGSTNTSRLDIWAGNPTVDDLAVTPTFTTGTTASPKAGLVLAITDGAFESIAQTTQQVSTAGSSQPVTPATNDALLVIFAALRGAAAADYGVATPAGWTAAGARTTNVSGQGRTGMFAFYRKLNGQKGQQQPAVTLQMTFATQTTTTARFHVATIVVRRAPNRYRLTSGSTWIPVTKIRI